MKLKIEKAMLVYQAGIANVFKVDKITVHYNDGRNARRLLQGDFCSCAMLASGMELAGTEVATVYCNRTGDVEDKNWSWKLDKAPFAKSIFRVGINFTKPTARGERLRTHAQLAAHHGGAQ